MSLPRKRILCDDYYSSGDEEQEVAIHRGSQSEKTSISSKRDEASTLNKDGDIMDSSTKDDVVYLATEDYSGYDKTMDSGACVDSEAKHEAMVMTPSDDQTKERLSKLPIYYPGIFGCRSVSEFECLNRIEEGTYGVVYRAIEKKTGQVVALKRLKMENEKQGFPITSLREINMLLKCGNHPNVVNVREVVVGSNMDKIYMVMEFLEHDMKSLMNQMAAKSKKFTKAQVKTLLKQLLSGCKYMHDEFILHRDLKTSNLLMSHNGILKIGDFGLAREYGDPLKAYSPVVVTLWYRSPELLLRTETYSTEVDIWAVGCIFAEFIKLEPLFPGKSELDQLNKIFKIIGTPTEKIWPGYNELHGAKHFQFEHYTFNELKKHFGNYLPTTAGMELLKRLLAASPSHRYTATEALESPYFEEEPFPTPPHLFPTWPAKSEQNKKPPVVKTEVKPKKEEKIVEMTENQLKLFKEMDVDVKNAPTGFTLKFDAPKRKRR